MQKQQDKNVLRIKIRVNYFMQEKISQKIANLDQALTGLYVIALSFSINIFKTFLVSLFKCPDPLYCGSSESFTETWQMCRKKLARKLQIQMTQDLSPLQVIAFHFPMNIFLNSFSVSIQMSRPFMWQTLCYFESFPDACQMRT